jgi:hypothetical protein
MVAELNKLSAEHFQIILTAFGQAIGEDLSPETTADVLIGAHLGEQIVTLNREAFADHPQLIRPYGLHQANLERDLSRLPEDIQLVLRGYIPEEITMGAFYKENMQVLKEVTQALLAPQ